MCIYAYLIVYISEHVHDFAHLRNMRTYLHIYVHVYVVFSLLFFLVWDDYMYVRIIYSLARTTRTSLKPVSSY